MGTWRTDCTPRWSNAFFSLEGKSAGPPWMIWPALSRRFHRANGLAGLDFAPALTPRDAFGFAAFQLATTTVLPTSPWKRYARLTPAARPTRARDVGDATPPIGPFGQLLSNGGGRSQEGGATDLLLGGAGALR